MLRRELGVKKRTVEVLKMLQMYCDDDEMDLKEKYNLEALDLCRQMDSPIWLASSLNQLAEIARKRGHTSRADDLEAESRSVYTPPPTDPDVDDAFKAALGSGDMNKMRDAVKMIGERKR